MVQGMSRQPTKLIAAGDIVRRPTDRAQGVVLSRRGIWTVEVKWPSGVKEIVKITELIRVA
jgi:hypothetical protein